MSHHSKQILKRFFHVGNPDWTVRRRIVVYSLLFCGAEIFWASQWMRIETATMVIGQCFTMATLIISGYVIANVADDHLKRKAEAGELGSPDQNVNVQTANANIAPGNTTGAP